MLVKKIFLISGALIMASGCGLFDSSSSRSNNTNPNLNNGGTTTVEAPTFDPIAGSYTSAQSVKITSATTDAEIHYTTDSTAPTCSSGSTYANAISVASTETIKAIACKDGMNNSDVETAVYTINIGGGQQQVGALAFYPVPGPQTSSSIPLTITSTTGTAKIYYTINGTTPVCFSGTYMNSGSHVDLTIPSTGVTVKAIGCKSDMLPSAPGRATYTLSLGTVGTPTIVPSTGPQTSSPVSVTMTSTPVSALIYYTTDGTTPACFSGTFIESGSHVRIAIPTAGVTVKAKGCKTGWTPSAQSSATYILQQNCGGIGGPCCFNICDLENSNNSYACNDEGDYCDLISKTCQHKKANGQACGADCECIVECCDGVTNKCASPIHCN
ncbi:MAG: chitobiase/beta-hexosaminidase C-terminal domain-containing protein [Proteobacteria bacterium]|nr:chitobiase/beta-hexosaminidase C-terminal domain-containing protein [Pseudomonadota bacterium]